MTDKSKGGRPTRYTPETGEQARKLIALGATQADLASFFQVTEKTITNWKNKHPGFFQAIKESKEVFDARMEDSLSRRAQGGYETTESRVTVDGKGNVINKMMVKKTLAPDTSALIFWLKNRQPERWRDKPGEKGSNESLAEAMSKLADKLPD